MATYKAFINPLIMTSFMHMTNQQKEGVTFEDVLRFINFDKSEFSMDVFLERYKKITQGTQNIFAPPADQNFLEKIIWPVKNAKVNYLIGNFLGTIALCGMVAEMASILLFEMIPIQINGHLMDKEKQTLLFGSSFERLGQDKRVDILFAYNIISDEIRQLFTNIRNLRKKYIHYYSQKHDLIESDSFAIYRDTVIVIDKIIGQNVRDGALEFNPAFMEYITKKGLVNEIEEEE